MSLNELFVWFATEYWSQKLYHDNTSLLNLSTVSFGGFACESFGLDDIEELIVLFVWTEELSALLFENMLSIFTKISLISSENCRYLFISFYQSFSLIF